MFKKITVFILALTVILSSFLFGFTPKKLPGGTKISSFIKNITGKNYITDLIAASSKPGILTEKELEKIIAEIKKSRYLIKTVYLPWPAEKLTTPETATILKKFHRENIKVFYLVNRTELLNTPAEAEKIITSLINYNEQQQRSNKDFFDGLVFDLKPYLHPLWQDQPEKLLAALLEIMENSKKIIADKNSTIPLAVSLPYTFGLNKKTEQDFFYQAFNYINIVNIYPFANEVNDILQNITWLTDYATETKTIFNIGLFLNKLPDPALTYYNSNSNLFNYSIAEIEKQLKKNKNFNTLIFNELLPLHYDFTPAIPTTSPEKVKITSQETLLRPATPNQEAALLSVYQKEGYLHLQFSVSDNSYISTAKGIRENDITDDHLALTFQAYPAAGYPKQGILAFKVSAGNEKENILPYLSAVQPQTANFSNWIISSEVAESHYKLFLTIPLKELFFNFKKENWLYFQFKITNQKTTSGQEEYSSEQFLFLFSPDNND